MIIRMTKKAADKIKVKTLKSETTPQVFDEWYVNLFNFGRTKYFIMTDSVSLFSTIFCAKGINNISGFLKKVNEEIDLIFNEYDIKKKISLENASFFSTNNRSIVGSIVDIMKMAYTVNLNDEEELKNVILFCNRIPMSYLDYKSPLEIIKNMKLTDKEFNKNIFTF